MGGYKDNANCYTTIQAPKGDQIRFTFTQMNLELEGCSPGRPNKGCPDGGCDYVALYDGKDNHAKLIGKYSGYKTGADLPEIISTGRYMRVQFHTVSGAHHVLGVEHLLGKLWHGECTVLL